MKQQTALRREIGPFANIVKERISVVDRVDPEPRRVEHLLPSGFIASQHYAEGIPLRDASRGSIAHAETLVGRELLDRPNFLGCERYLLHEDVLALGIPVQGSRANNHQLILGMRHA